MQQTPQVDARLFALLFGGSSKLTCTFAQRCTRAADSAFQHMHNQAEHDGRNSGSMAGVYGPGKFIVICLFFCMLLDFKFVHFIYFNVLQCLTLLHEYINIKFTEIGVQTPY